MRRYDWAKIADQLLSLELPDKPTNRQVFINTQERVTSQMISKEQALTGNEFHINGECVRTIGKRGGIKEKIKLYRRSGQTKLWKTRPDEFRVPVRSGLYDNGYITHENAHLVHLASECESGGNLTVIDKRTQREREREWTASQLTS